jgi:hypothetical protein
MKHGDPDNAHEFFFAVLLLLMSLAAVFGAIV